MSLGKSVSHSLDLDLFRLFNHGEVFLLVSVWLDLFDFLL